MASLVFFLALLTYSFALPNIDWSQVKPKYAYLEPLPNATSHPQGRIVGGIEVSRNTLPYQVGVLIDGNNLCGGSIIAETWVLTAAHCTYRGSYARLVLGAHNILVAETTQIIITSRSIINHPNYSYGLLHDDIALIRTPYPISYNNNIQPVTIPPASASDFTGEIGVLAGWGTVSETDFHVATALRQVALFIISNSVCAETYGDSITSSILCTSGAGIVGACRGDSGSPLVVNGVQVGIASFISPRGCETGSPSGFVRVSWYRDWIEEHTGL